MNQLSRAFVGLFCVLGSVLSSMQVAHAGTSEDDLKTILFVEQRASYDNRLMVVYDSERRHLGNVTTTFEGPRAGMRYYFDSAESKIRLARAEVKPRVTRLEFFMFDTLDRPMARVETRVKHGYKKGLITNAYGQVFEYVRDYGWFGKVTYRLYDSSGALKATWSRKARKLRDRWEIKVVPGFEQVLDPSVLAFMASIKTWSDSY